MEPRSNPNLFRSGWSEMDRQHGHLCDSFAYLGAAPRNRRLDLPELKRIISEMTGHFEWEEREMRESGYPDLARHHSDHQRQLSNLRGMLMLVEEGSEMLDTVFFQACEQWNYRHIRGQDSDFSLFLLDRETWDLQRELRDWDLEVRMNAMPA